MLREPRLGKAPVKDSKGVWFLMSDDASSRRLRKIQPAAEYADVHPRTIRRRIADGSLTGYRFGPRVLLVDLNELDALLRPIPTAGSAA